MNALLARHIYPLSVESSKVGEYSEVAKMQNCRALSFQLGIKMHLEAIKPYGGFSAKKKGITDACSTTDCCSLLSIVDNVPQTCPRCCPRHAPDDAPDMPQMMPQTCPR